VNFVSLKKGDVYFQLIEKVLNFAMLQVNEVSFLISIKKPKLLGFGLSFELSFN